MLNTLSVWAIYEVTSFPWRVFLRFIWNPATRTRVHSMVPKRSFLVTSGKFCCFLVELFHTEMCVVCGEGRSHCWAPGSQCASVSQAVEILLRYFLTVLSWALPKKQGRSLEGGDDTAVVNEGTTLAAAEDAVTYWKRRWNVGRS